MVLSYQEASVIYVRFHPDIEHHETCGFEQYNVSLQSMGPCGERAIGYTGRNRDSRVHLCRSHFDYTRSLAGIHSTDVPFEKGPDDE